MIETLKEQILKRYYLIYFFATLLITIKFKYFDEFQYYFFAYPEFSFIYTIIISVSNDAKSKDIGNFQVLLHCLVHFFHKFFLLNKIFTGSWILADPFRFKTIFIFSMLTIFFIFKKQFVHMYEKYLTFQIGIAFGNGLAVANIINKIVDNTLFKKDRVLFWSPSVDCFVLCLLMSICVPSHKYVESYFGLGCKNAYRASFKKAVIYFAIPLCYLIVLEAYYLTHIEQFVHYTVDVDHPFRDPKKFFTFSNNAIWLYIASYQSIQILRKKRLNTIWKRIVGRDWGQKFYTKQPIQPQQYKKSKSI